MNCPHCNHPESRVTETRSGPDADRRIRICRSCGKTFQTMERVAVFAGRAIGYLEATVADALVDPEEPEPLAPAIAACFHPVVVGDELNGLPMSVRSNLVEWWNNSRYSKHKKQATWTRQAWLFTVKRIAALPHWQQELLAAAGVEHGWQTLKVDYIKGATPPKEAGLQPKSSAIQEAIQAWNTSVA